MLREPSRVKVMGRQKHWRPHLSSRKYAMPTNADSFLAVGLGARVENMAPRLWRSVQDAQEIFFASVTQ